MGISCVSWACWSIVGRRPGVALVGVTIPAVALGAAVVAVVRASSVLAAAAGIPILAAGVRNNTPPAVVSDIFACAAVAVVKLAELSQKRHDVTTSRWISSAYLLRKCRLCVAAPERRVQARKRRTIYTESPPGMFLRPRCTFRHILEQAVNILPKPMTTQGESYTSNGWGEWNARVKKRPLLLSLTPSRVSKARERVEKPTPVVRKMIKKLD